MTRGPVDIGVDSLPVDVRDTVRRLVRMARREAYDDGYNDRSLELAQDTVTRREAERKAFPWREGALRVIPEANKAAEATGVGWVRVEHKLGAKELTYTAVHPAAEQVRELEEAQS